MSTPTSVYRYYDSDGALVYVGITARGVQRQNEHNAHAEWWPYVARQDVEHYPDRDEAAARERELIQRFRPPFNKQHNDGYDVLKAAYLETARPVRQAVRCSTEETEAGCDDGDTCPAFMPNVFSAWCGDRDCLSCHRAWHSYSFGYDQGVAHGKDQLAQSIANWCAWDDEGIAHAAYAFKAAGERLAYMLEKLGPPNWGADAAGEIREFLPSEAYVESAFDVRAHFASRESN